MATRVENTFEKSSLDSSSVGIKEFFTAHKASFFVWLFLTVLLALVMVANAYLLKYLTEAVTQNNWDIYRTVALIAGLYMIVQGSVHYLRQKNSAILSLKILNSFRENFFHRIIRANLFSLREQSAEKYLSQFTTQLTVVKSSYLDTFTWGTYLFFQFIFATCLAFYINPLLAVLSLVLCLPLIAVPAVSKKIISRKAQEVAKSTDHLNEYLGDMIQSAADWKMALAAQDINRKFKTSLSDWEEKSTSAAKVEQRIDAVNSTFTNILYFGVWIIGGALVLGGYNNLGEIVAFAQLISNISVPLYSATSLISEFYAGRATLREIDRNLDFPAETETAGTDLTSLDSITYRDYEPVSHGKKVNLHFDSNKKYLLIGASGSGKSSLLYPVLKLTRPADKTVLVNNTDINTISASSLFRQIGYISQFSRIINASVAENVRLYQDNIGEEKIREAIKESGLEHLTGSDGLQREVTNSLIGMSGGEKQRLLIARLLVRNYKFCIFDEITSGLDGYNAKLIEEKIFKEFSGFIYITHHYDNEFIKKFDAIVSIGGDGNIDMRTPEDLLTQEL